MKEIRLRHHHLLCTMLFTGHGYDIRFVTTLERVVSSLRSPKGLTVRLSSSRDDICRSCPNEEAGRCQEGDSVLDKDRAVARFLDLPEEGLLPAEPLMKLVRERMHGLNDISLVCGECEWAVLCNARLKSDRERCPH